jgi:hypothetical protein
MADTPGQIGLIPGLMNASQRADEAARAVLAAVTAGNLPEARRQAEGLHNVVVGDQDPGYGDLNGDGQVSDPGDGYGLLLNGDHVGYIEGAMSHAGYAAATADTNANVQMHAVHVEICAENLEGWAPQLRDLARQVAAGATGQELQDAARQAASLAERILHGVDLDGDERIQPVPGEGGAETARQHAYYRALLFVYRGPHVMPPVAAPLATHVPFETPYPR